MTRSAVAKPHDPTTGRKAAYFARNRAALIRAAQAVFADEGPEATIEQIADRAQVSVSTIYKHFDSKDALLETSLLSAMSDWEAWMAGRMMGITDPLEQLFTPIRLFLRMRSTHPRYAQLVSRNLEFVSQRTPSLTTTMRDHVLQLVNDGVLTNDNAIVRFNNLRAVIFGTMQVQLLDPGARDTDADLAIEIAIGMLGITPARAKKLMSAPLPDLTPAPAPF